MNNTGLLFFSLVILAFPSCNSGTKVSHGAGEPVVIYKTRHDYRDLITVKLSEDGMHIAAFPAPSDVVHQQPVELAGGYLLKKMVGDVFLSLTIEEYAESSRSFTAEDLLELVIDRDPYLEVYDCTGCTAADTASINMLIRNNKLGCCNSLLAATSQ